MRTEARRLPVRSASRPRELRAGRRRGGMILELILALPIFLIVIFAAVQLGLYFVNLQQVTFASRVGAEEASQTADLGDYGEGDPVPDNVLAAINQQLQTAGIEACRVKLEHNVGGTPVTLASPPDSGCDCGPETPLNGAVPDTYVRLTICVPLSELIPGLLCWRGYDVSDPSQVSGCTTTFRYELSE